jgi:hypothetical protein
MKDSPRVAEHTYINTCNRGHELSRARENPIKREREREREREQSTSRKTVRELKRATQKTELYTCTRKTKRSLALLYEQRTERAGGRETLRVCARVCGKRKIIRAMRKTPAENRRLLH